MRYAAIVLLLIGFSSFAENLNAAESETNKKTKPSAGFINDILRKEFPAARNWDFGGQFRIRAESRDSGSFPNRDFAKNLGPENDYFLFRTKVHLGWSPKKWFTAYIEARDAHAASDARVAPENDSLDLYQAYVRLGDPEQFPFSLKAGRQELIYGDQRHIGNGDWSNTGRSFDAVKLSFQNNTFWMDAFVARPVLAKDGRFNNANHHDWFSGLYGSTRRIASWQDTQFFVLARNVGARSSAVGGAGPRDIYTFGTRWKSLPEKLGPWDYSLEAAKQYGSILQSGKRLDHTAFALNVSGGHSWKKAFGAPRLGFGYDYGTGDSDPSDSWNETFECLFGTNHRFYGNMDLMGLRNMHIAKIEVSMKPAKKVSVSAEWLGFWLADTADFLYPESGSGRNQNGYGRHPGYSSHVGRELDFLVDWRPVPWGLLRTGYGRFFVGDYIRRSINSVPANGGTADADWFYLQIGMDF